MLFLVVYVILLTAFVSIQKIKTKQTKNHFLVCLAVRLQYACMTLCLSDMTVSLLGASRSVDLFLYLYVFMFVTQKRLTRLICSGRTAS